MGTFALMSNSDYVLCETEGDAYICGRWKQRSGPPRSAPPTPGTAAGRTKPCRSVSTGSGGAANPWNGCAAGCQAVETGFQTLQEGLSQSPLLHSVDDRLQQVQETLDQLGEVGSRPAVAMPATNGPQVQRPNGSYGPSTSRIVAVGVMLLGWIAVLWFHTGDAKIAISGVIAVNLIGCLLLSGRTDGDRG